MFSPSSVIHSLPNDLVALIAAGEVIDSWAAVVRELVENAIDAEATHLTLTLRPESWQLQLVDNGRGMAIAELQVCAQPHSTSKIKNLDDLWHISSLGFRGEALHSLAQVADLTVTSRPAIAPDATGWQVRFSHQGQPDRLEPTAIAPGTIVTVNNLFGTIPQRREGLPGLNQQLKSIQTLIYHFALCHPALIWQVYYSDRLWLSLSPGKTAQDILPQILKNTHFQDFCAIVEQIEPSDRLPSAQLSLVLGLPDRCHRRRPDWVKVAINGRVVRSPNLEQALLAGFARSLPRDRYPVCFLHLTLPPDQVDWNRNPSKSEIYLKNNELWLQQVGQLCDRVLRFTPASLPTKIHNQRLGKLLKVAESGASYQTSPLLDDSLSLMPLKAVGQVNQTYIVAEHSAGLWLVEQHIAHERVIFEKLQANWQIISLESPLLIENLTPKQQGQLRRIGLDLEDFGQDCWAVRSLPQALAEREDRLDALQELSLGGDLETAQVATACRTAIRNGTALSHDQMQQLLQDWQRSRNPHTCPHGRPIYLALEESSLARFFRRNWVIGKSHGI